MEGILRGPYENYEIRYFDIINRANLGMEVIHERNAHNFPLDLAFVESPSLEGWIYNNSPILITKKPNLNDHVLRANLAKGMGHNKRK